MRYAAFAVLALVVLAGCVSPPQGGGNASNNTTNVTIPPGYQNKEYCTANSDCVRLNSCCDCGLGTYVNKYNQAPQCPQGSPTCKCAIISSHGECQSNKCVGVADSPVSPPQNTTPPGYEVKDYCRQDSDCVRLNSCCDCGMGTYVNKYNQQEPICSGPRCLCPTAPSSGACVNNKCVAVQGYRTIGLEFNSSTGYCGNETAPSISYTAEGMALNGSVGGGSVCRYAVAEIFAEGGAYTLNISTRAIPGVAACINCAGAIPWNANISGYNGTLNVYYDGRLVYPPTATGFCGWSTSGACSSDSDCVRGGCSGEVCQSAAEQPAVTTCIYRDCYNASASGVNCGCVAGRCRWG